jgi:MFS family permease
MEEKKIGYRDILKQREYMKTIIADIINRFGDSIDSVAFVWLVYQVTQSAAWSAIIFGVNRIPSVFLQPFAGAAIEGRNKKVIMVFTDIIRGLCVGFVAISMVFGFVNQWILLVVTLVISSAEAFRGPAGTALLPKLLDKKYYEFGISLSKSSSSIVELVGLGLAGAIIAATSVSTAIFIDMTTFFLSATILFTLRVKEETLKKAKINAKEYLVTLKGGFAYLGRNSFLRYFVVLAVFLNAILVPFNSLTAPLASEVLHADEYMLSVLGITLSIGMLVGAVLYPYISRKLSKWMITCLGGYSIALFYFGFVLIGRFINSILLTYLCVSVVAFIVGLAISLLTSLCNIEFMKNVEEEYLARTAAIFGAGCVAAMPVVSFIVSAVVGFTSTQTLFIIAGTLDILICLRLCRRKIFQSMNDKNKEKLANVQTDEVNEIAETN